MTALVLSARRALFPALAGLLALAAWAALWAWSASPWARYLEHARWTEIGFAAALCAALPAGETLVPVLLHALAWVLMIAAMMLPTTLPLVSVFGRLVGGRPDAARLFALLVGGYALAWLGFGLAAQALDGALLWLARETALLTTHGWALGAAVVGTAGLFQFSALKYRCLDECRAPTSFVMQRWSARAPARDALRIGLAHGLFCVGCCWALMLLMFVVGMGSVGWMLALGAVMAVEKNLPGGRRLSAPLGLALLGWAGAIVVANA